MRDFEQLLGETHRRGMKLLLDLVPNHTSDEHPWFVESRSSRDNPKRDWYIWRDPTPDGGPPNNWLSVFGGSAWEGDEATGQFYYHAFHRKQPDLNWRNPAVREAMFDIMRFWFDLGVDGFRVDVIWHLIKDQHFRDNPKNPHFTEGDFPYRSLIPAFSTDQPEVHDAIAGMRKVADEYPDRLLIGEIYLPIAELVTYYGRLDSGIHLPFNFLLIIRRWEAAEIGAAISEYEAALPENAWPNWVLGNHDMSRIASRVGAAQARVAAMLLLTLRGTLTLYYGDEIGMHDVDIPAGEVRDPQAVNHGDTSYGRDPARTPMQWTSEPGAGFTSGRPWLRIAHDFRTTNVKTEESDPVSMLSLYRRLIDLRKSESAILVGEYEPIRAEGTLFAYVRQHLSGRFLIALNFGHEMERLSLPDMSGNVVVSTSLDREGESIEGQLILRQDEGVVVRLK
jgi:alpha-glucosidase